MDLKTVKLSDLGKVVTGKTPPTKNEEYYGDKFPFITPTDINGTARYIDPGRYLSEEGYNYQENVLLPSESICFVCIGATIGKICMTKEPSFTNQQINSIKPDTDKHDAKFIYYLLSTKGGELKKIAGGAATPIVNKSSFSDFKIKVPNLETQRKIASILSAFDDLIENNTRRIEILEEMARRIYREWFVHFRYPGHEENNPSTGSGQRLVDSELGKIPEGWEVKKFGEICELMYSGGTPLRRENKFWEDGTIKWYKTKELQDNFLFESEEKINEIAVDESSAKGFPADTVLMAIYGSPTVGRLGITTERCSCNQAALGMIADKKYCSQYYLYFALYNLREYFNSISQGAAQQNISKTKVKNTSFLLANREIINQFDKAIDKIFNLIKNLTKKNIILKQTRDLLLPKLISGEVEVGEINLNS